MCFPCLKTDQFIDFLKHFRFFKFKHILKIWLKIVKNSPNEDSASFLHSYFAPDAKLNINDLIYLLKFDEMKTVGKTKAVLSRKIQLLYCHGGKRILWQKSWFHYENLWIFWGKVLNFFQCNIPCSYIAFSPFKNFWRKSYLTEVLNFFPKPI